MADHDLNADPAKYFSGPNGVLRKNTLAEPINIWKKNIHSSARLVF